MDYASFFFILIMPSSFRRAIVANVTRSAFDALASDALRVTNDLAIIAVTAGTFESVATSGFTGFYRVYVNPTMRDQWEELVKPQLLGNVHFIAEELGLVDPALKTNFLHVTSDWSATRNEEKYTILSTLRSAPFDEFLMKCYGRERFSKASWYHNGVETSFWSAKLLIQGTQEDRNLSGPAIRAIDKTVSELTRCFRDLSVLGKFGGALSRVEDCYRDSIAYFADALRPTREMLRSYP